MADKSETTFELTEQRSINKETLNKTTQSTKAQLKCPVIKKYGRPEITQQQ